VLEVAIERRDKAGRQTIMDSIALFVGLVKFYALGANRTRAPWKYQLSKGVYGYRIDAGQCDDELTPGGFLQSLGMTRMRRRIARTRFFIPPLAMRGGMNKKFY